MANRSDLATLADKVEYLFKTKFNPNATKTKSKSVEEEVNILVLILTFYKQFKLVEKVFDEYEVQLRQVFNHFSKSKQGGSQVF